MGGRLGAIWGHKNALLFGAIRWTVWTLVNTFCLATISFNVARAFSGIDAGIILPNTVALIGTTFPPGKKRNLTTALSRAAELIGGGSGPAVAGLFTQALPWKWLFVVL